RITDCDDRRRAFAGEALNMEREVRYCTTSDGVRIAYSAEGEGPPLLFLQFLYSFSAISFQRWTRLSAGSAAAAGWSATTSGAAVSRNVKLMTSRRLRICSIWKLLCEPLGWSASPSWPPVMAARAA